MLDPETLRELFEKHRDEFLKFSRISPDRLKHVRPDLNAFLLLDSLVPDTRDMVTGAEHDEICLGVGYCSFAEAATEEDVIDLIRCGVRYTRDNGLCMFV